MYRLLGLLVSLSKRQVCKFKPLTVAPLSLQRDWVIFSEPRGITFWRHFFSPGVKGNPNNRNEPYRERGVGFNSSHSCSQIMLCLRLPYRFGCNKYCCCVVELSSAQLHTGSKIHHTGWWPCTVLQHWLFIVCAGFNVFFLPSDHQGWGGAWWSQWSSKTFQHPRRLNSRTGTLQ